MYIRVYRIVEQLQHKMKKEIKHVLLSDGAW